MLMFTAMQIINGIEKSKGFMVHFERKEGCMLASDYFPDKRAGERLIQTEEEAWMLARKFADRTVGRCLNIYVVAHDFVPVPGYTARKIENRISQHDVAVRFAHEHAGSGGWWCGE